MEPTEPEYNLITLYLEYSKNSETPEIFHFWSILFGISCALGRRCWIDMSMFTIYPNLYVILVAESGRQRKSTGIDIIDDMLSELQPPPNMIADKITPEALLEAMRTPETSPENSNVILQEKCEGYAIVDELTTFLNAKVYEAGMGPLLTKLYDCKRVVEYHTKGGGRLTLRNVCLGLLGGTTIDFLREAIPEHAIGHGVTSRVLFITSSLAGEPVPIPKTDKSKRQEIINGLQRICFLRGEFRWNGPDVIQYYVNRYKEWQTTSPLHNHKHLMAYASRRWIHAFKIAMALSAATRADMLITIKELKAADEILSQIEENLPYLVSLITASEQGQLMTWIEAIVAGAKKMSRMDLMRITSNKLNTRDLEVLLDTLVKSGRLVETLEANVLQYTTGPNSEFKDTGKKKGL